MANLAACLAIANRRALIPAALLVLFGVAGMAAWHLHLKFPVQIDPAYAPMQYNTTLGFVLSGMALWAAARMQLLFGGLLALLGGMTLA